MGDVLHALPAVALLRAHWPQAVLGWAIEPRWAALLQANAQAQPGTPAMPLVDRVHAVPTRAWSKQPVSLATLRSVLALRRQLRAMRYDIAIDLQGSLRSAAIARATGARRVVGSATPRELPARWFYRTCVPVAAAHVIDQACEIVQAAVGSSQAATSPLPSMLPVDRAAEAWVDSALQQTTTGQPERFCNEVQIDERSPARRDANDRLVFLAPTAGWGAKEWPPDRFAALAAALVQQGHRVLINSTPPLPDMTADTVCRTAHALLLPVLQHQVRSVTATLPQLLALLRRVDVVVAGDTGPLHLAAALGKPTVALFGPTDPARNGPHTANAIVLRDPASVTDHRRHAATEAGLARIPVDTVRTAVTSLLVS